ncbi:hypothetical protein [Streptomyces sp. NPDC057677]|uniref:hypothetical protein n=1 Tax=unclassified Streptomyces TaxID=2593676 RepID=UPI0036860339
MTELTTALIAGLIGLIGTVVGAAATAWAARTTANKSAEALRGQAQDQAANEHAHWLRQQQLTTCEGFLDAWDECTRKRKELSRPVEESEHHAVRAELSRSASLMMERARRISLLGPEDVSLAAEEISRATLENIEKEDKFGQYIKSALSRLREEEGQIQSALPSPQLGDLREALRHVDDLERLQELYSLEQLEGIVDEAGRSITETEDLLRRLAAFEDLGREISTVAARFVADFKRNLQVAEESRAVFTQTARSAIARPSRHTA